MVIVVGIIVEVDGVSLQWKWCTKTWLTWLIIGLIVGVKLLWVPTTIFRASAVWIDHRYVHPMMIHLFVRWHRRRSMVCLRCKRLRRYRAIVVLRGSARGLRHDGYILAHVSPRSETISTSIKPLLMDTVHKNNFMNQK